MRVPRQVRFRSPTSTPTAWASRASIRTRSARRTSYSFPATPCCRRGTLERFATKSEGQRSIVIKALEGESLQPGDCITAASATELQITCQTSSDRLVGHDSRRQRWPRPSLLRAAGRPTRRLGQYCHAKLSKNKCLAGTSQFFDGEANSDHGWDSDTIIVKQQHAPIFCFRLQTPEPPVWLLRGYQILKSPLCSNATVSLIGNISINALAALGQVSGDRHRSGHQQRLRRDQGRPAHADHSIITTTVAINLPGNLSSFSTARSSPSGSVIHTPIFRTFFREGCSVHSVYSLARQIRDSLIRQSTFANRSA